MDNFDNLVIPSVSQYLEDYNQTLNNFNESPSGPLTESEKAIAKDHLRPMVDYLIEVELEREEGDCIDLNAETPHWEDDPIVDLSYYVLNNCYLGSVLHTEVGFEWGVAFINKYEIWSEVIDGVEDTERKAMKALEKAYRRLRSQSKKGE